MLKMLSVKPFTHIQSFIASSVSGYCYVPVQSMLQSGITSTLSTSCIGIW